MFSDGLNNSNGYSPYVEMDKACLGIKLSFIVVQVDKANVQSAENSFQMDYLRIKFYLW